MVTDILAIESGNARNVKGLCKSTMKLKLLQFEQLANIFTKEPYIIYVRKTKKSELLIGGIIFYHRKHILNKSISSWTIYNLDNEKGDLLIRYSCWDKMVDIKHLYSKDETIDRANYKPTLKSQNFYIKKKDSIKINEYLYNIKGQLSRGLSFWKEGGQEDIAEQELSMWLDGYSASYNWQYPLVNVELSDSLSKIESEFDRLINLCNYTVEEIQLDYSCPLNIFYKYILGEEESNQ